MMRCLLVVALAALPVLAVGRGGLFPVRPGEVPRVPPAERKSASVEPIDLAGIEARTRLFEERAARAGRLPGAGEAREPLSVHVERARRSLDAGDFESLGAAADHVAKAGASMRARADAMMKHLDALERSVATSPHSEVIRARLRAQREELTRRRELATDELEAIGQGISDRQDGGFSNRVLDVVRRIFRRDPDSRVVKLQGRLRDWGAAERPPVLGAVLSNEGLSYVNWGTKHPAMPSGSVVPAYADAAAGVQLEDTTKDQETEQSDDLVAKAQALGSPAAIYGFVKNELRLEWYRGCLKGAVETLREGGGNDADLAALLISLLRARDVPARYVYGTIELSLGKLADLMGLLDATVLDAYYAAPMVYAVPSPTRDLVIRILEAAGIPFEPVITGGQLRSVRIAHVWVEAYFPYADYRGAGGTGGRQWVPIDPAIPGGPKYEMRAAAIDVLPGVSGGAQAIVDEYLADPNATSPLDVFRTKAQAVVAAAGGGLGYDDAQRRVVVRREDLPLVPGSLPYTVVGVQAEYVTLPDSLKHHARIKVADLQGTALDVTLPVHRLAGHRSILIYVPATQVDEELIMGAGSLWDAPASIVEMRPVIRIGGASVAEGARAIGLGATQRWTIELSDPNGGVRRVENPVMAGNLVAMSFGAPRNGYVEGEMYLEGDEDGAAPRFDYGQAVAYTNAWTDAEAELARVLHVIPVHPEASVTLFESQLAVEEVLGVRQRVSWKGLAIDADLRPMVPVPLVAGREQDLFRLSGLQGSWQEASTLETGVGVRSISTVTLLREARAQGVPVLKITPQNRDQMLPQLDVVPEIRAEVEDHLARGREITVPAQTMKVVDWTGSGYVALNPSTGEGGYFLSGEVSGGMTVLSTLRWAETNEWLVAHMFPGGTATIEWSDDFTKQRVSNISKVRVSDEDLFTVIGKISKPLTVMVIAQWVKRVCPDGMTVCTDAQKTMKKFAARVSGAPVTFTRFNGAEFAFGTSAEALQPLLLGAPQAVIDRVHLAAHDQGSSGAVGTLSRGVGTLTEDTGPSGLATIYVTPDPVIGNGRSAFLYPVAGKSELEMEGLNEVMATVMGVRPHDSTSYALKLMEPFVVIGLPEAPDRIEIVGSDELTDVPAGIEIGSALLARVVDRFANALSNQTVIWSDDGVGGRFVNVNGLGGVESDGAPLAPQIINYQSQLQQEPSVPLNTGPFWPVRTSYIPPYSRYGLDMYVTVKSGALESKRVHILGPPGVSYYLAVSPHRTLTNWGGITGTYFPSPTVAVIYGLTDGQWAPVTDKTDGLQSIEVRAYTTTDGPNPVWEEQSTSDGLSFGDDGGVRIRPRYIANGGLQTTWFTATAVNDKGDEVCCSNSWYAAATAGKVGVSFSRFDSALTASDLPNPDASKADHTLARTTDQYLRLRVDNPSDEPVYVRVAQSATPILFTKTVVGYAGDTFGIAGLLPLPPGGTDLLIPVIHQGWTMDPDGKWIACGNGGVTCPPDVRATVPTAGMVGFEVWAPYKRINSTNVPEPLDHTPGTGSVSHNLPLVPDATPYGIPVVQFVGGYQCTYSILDRVLSCADPGNAASPFRTIEQETYSGHWAKTATNGGTCINNPCAQCWVSGSYSGPLSEGSYVIEPGFLDPDRDFMSYKLKRLNSLCGGDQVPTVDPRVVEPIVSFGDFFMIHFGKNTQDSLVGGVFSEGCVVVVSDTDRDRINTLGGGTLTVIAADPALGKPFDRARCPFKTVITTGTPPVTVYHAYGHGWVGSASNPCADLTDGTH